MRITRAVVPSLFTTLNIFCGFLAIISADQGQIQHAAWFIILAAIFDSLDGVMARITKSSSQFGVELDSLARRSFFWSSSLFYGIPGVFCNRSITSVLSLHPCPCSLERFVWQDLMFNW